MHVENVCADITKEFPDPGKNLPHMGKVPHDDNEGSRDIEKSLMHVSNVLLHVSGALLHVDQASREPSENPFELLFFLPDMHAKKKDVAFSRADMREEEKDLVLSLPDVHPPTILYTISAFVPKKRAFVLNQGSSVLKQRAFVHNPASAVDKDDPVHPAEFAGRNNMARFVRQPGCDHVTNRPSHGRRRSGMTS